MRHYSLVPVRYNAQQLLTRCEPIDAELWSIQWRGNQWNGDPETRDAGVHWFADVAPAEHDEAEAIVTWLNNRQQFFATLTPAADVRPFNRSK